MDQNFAMTAARMNCEEVQRKTADERPHMQPRSTRACLAQVQPFFCQWREAMLGGGVREWAASVKGGGDQAKDRHGTGQKH